MADRRMFSKKITDSDAFIEMPAATQALYFHLNQAADDDGFNNQIQVAMMKAHASVDDFKILMMKRFVIRFESGVIVIKHWRMHNVLRKDRYTPTAFQDEMAQLGVKDNLSYTLDIGCQAVAKRLPQVRIGKDRLGKDKDIGADKPPTRQVFKPPSLEEITAYCQERKNEVSPQKFLDYFSASGWVDSNGNKVRNWKQKIITWEQNNKASPQKPKHDYNQRTYTAEYFEKDREESIKMIDDWYKEQTEKESRNDTATD